jgi:lysophospholipid acyltransferase (LPLAT)-like uncharacterized protein
MFKRLKFIIYTRPFIAFIYYFIRVYSMSLRLKVENENRWQDLRAQGTTVLLCAWHQQFFSAIYHFKTYSRFNPGLMISQSRDGDLISGVANKSGWHTPRGSSTRGGKQAMGTMISHLKTHGFGAHILDGPTGPMGRVKAGIIKMALETDAVVVPLYTSAEHAWYFNSWDRFMLPKPFSRVFITFGREVRFESSGQKDDFEDQRLLLEEIMRPGLLP